MLVNAFFEIVFGLSYVCGLTVVSGAGDSVNEL